MMLTSRRPALRRLIAATSAAAVLGVLGACGSESSEGGSATDASSESSDSGGLFGSDDSSGSTDIGGSDDTGEATELAQQNFYPSILQAQKDAGSYSFTLTLDTGEQSPQGLDGGKGEVVIDGDTTDSRVVMGDGVMEILTVDGQPYIKADGGADGLSTDGKYYKPDLQADDSLFSMFGGAQVDPGTMLKMVGQPASFEVLGHEEVDGVDTIHYKVGVAKEQYLESVPEQMRDMTASLAPDMVYVEVWVDGANQPRKLLQSLEVALGNTKSTTSTEMLMTDYGGDQEVTAPSDDEITTEDPLKKLGQMPG